MTEVTVEIPVFIYLMVTLAIFFSFYKVYLTLRDFFGFNTQEVTNRPEGEAASTDHSSVDHDNEETLLTRVSGTVRLTQAAEVIGKTLYSAKHLLRASFMIDFFLISAVLTKFICFLVGKNHY